MVHCASLGLSGGTSTIFCMVKVKCPVCSTSFRVKPYRLKGKHPPCCSPKCAREMLHSLGFTPWNSRRSEGAIKRASRLYRSTKRTVLSIAKELKISRSTLQSWASEFGWKKARDFSERTEYRRAAEAKIGRKLRAYEQTHHIDGTDDNAQSNLHVYPTARAHTRGHKSLERCAFELFRRGLINFDAGTGLYTLDSYPTR